MPEWPETAEKRAGHDRPAPRHGLGGRYSITWMFFFAHISLRTFGHTVTLTSPR
jgi:hypothetical protein